MAWVFAIIAILLAAAALTFAFALWRKNQTAADSSAASSADKDKLVQQTEQSLIQHRTQAAADKQRLDELIAENTHLREKENSAAANIAVLQTQLDNAHKVSQEKINQLLEVRESMKEQFNNLSQSILEEKGKKFDEESAKLLSPLKNDLAQFRQRIDAIHSEDEKARSALQRDIVNLQNNAAQYGQSADNLARALKKDSKIQGNWGEITLDTLLEKSGLREGEEYHKQQSLRDDEGNYLRPDVVINLPDDKHLIIDSKVSLRDYHDYVNANDDNAANIALSRHLIAIKNHINDLSKKHYSRLQNIHSPDFVFMFLPIEPAFIVALREDPNLFSMGYDKNIILCAPTTLMAVLQTVERIWQLERQNRNAEEIARQGGALYDKFHNFMGSMEGIDKALSNARESYDKAYKQLSSGRGNLIGQANKLVDLGVNAKKPKIPHNE